MLLKDFIQTYDGNVTINIYSKNGNHLFSLIKENPNVKYTNDIFGETRIDRFTIDQYSNQINVYLE